MPSSTRCWCVIKSRRILFSFFGSISKCFPWQAFTPLFFVVRHILLRMPPSLLCKDLNKAVPFWLRYYIVKLQYWFPWANTCLFLGIQKHHKNETAAYYRISLPSESLHCHCSCNSLDFTYIIQWCCIQILQWFLSFKLPITPNGLSLWNGAEIDGENLNRFDGVLNLDAQIFIIYNLIFHWENLLTL